MARKNSKKNRRGRRLSTTERLADSAIGRSKSSQRIGSSLRDGPKHGPVVSISIEEYEKSKKNDAVDTKPEESIKKKNYNTPKEQTSQTFISFHHVDLLLRSKSTNELDSIWSDLHKVEMDRETAALIISARRYLKGTDKSLRKYSDFLNEPNIAHFQLSGDLEDIPTTSRKTHNVPQIYSTQGKTRREIEQTIREGQPQFRKALLEYYGASCMVSGVQVVEVLEAAHISPYNGLQTNHITNGMILRSDIHKLFDKGLLGFHPEDFTIVLNQKLECTEYQEYSGKKLKLNEKAIFNIEAISKRWKEFISNNQ